MATIQSFSGTHPYDESHAALTVALDWHGYDFSEDQLKRLSAVHAEAATGHLESGTCPRCRGPLDAGNTAGSRITTCRCIPICPSCGEDEAIQRMLGKPYSRLWQWPTTKSAKTRRRNLAMKGAVTTTALVAPDGTVITEDGATELVPRQHPGGWAEFGMDEEAGDV